MLKILSNRPVVIINIITLLVTAMLLLSSCADPVPEDYVEEIYVEGFVITERPLTKIKILRTLPLTEPYSINKAVINDAFVSVKENGVDVPMIFVEDSLGGFYRAADTNFRAKYNSTYELTVVASGRTLQATATTLAPFQWVKPPKDTIVYPGKARETEFFDSLKISWEGQEGIPIYVLGIENLDTTGYGIYLTPPTDEHNDRVREDDFDDETLIANERTRYGLSFVSNSPIVWRVFKWYGKHRLHVYAGDNAFREWYQQVGAGHRSQYDYRLSNVEGGLGIWAGASVLTGDFFFKKEQTR